MLDDGQRRDDAKYEVTPMSEFLQNYGFFILVAILMLMCHMGHGGHRGHGRDRNGEGGKSGDGSGHRD